MLPIKHFTWKAKATDNDTDDQSAVSGSLNPTERLKLKSLAPEFKEEQHGSYVRRLEVAIENTSNRNIALTGRYGSGKSSILNKFLARQSQNKKRKTLRISINTLGPDAEEDLTNRIQKELVKQLLYRVQPGKVKRSRFARSKDLTWRRCLRDALVVGVLLCGLLWLFGVRPDAEAFGSSELGWLWTTIAWVALVVALAWIVRRAVGNRLISQFSTGGTSISFEKNPESYFDEYLDEIMAFFDATKPDIVVFEDIDRFDDSRIFDSLRELNTLINTSAHWEDRDPVRFVYAIKDSLFEKLGEEPPPESPESPPQSTSSDAVLVSAGDSASSQGRDAAKVAVERANRTKFFEVVIPVVPFLSHNNARDLLAEELTGRLWEGAEINRSLLDLVARHTTDMRLLINICNEFEVFAERLLRGPGVKPAPGMTADDLFALVVYKNFHLADFEKVPDQVSDLDTLELKREGLIRGSIRQLQRTRRELLQGESIQRKQDEVARSLGDRLVMLASVGDYRAAGIFAGEQRHELETASTPGFWKEVERTRTLALALNHRRSGYGAQVRYEGKELETLFPEGMDSILWAEPNAAKLAEQLASIDRDVTALRGADFADCAREDRFSVDGETFGNVVDRVLKSQLARDLVRRGFLTRYYAEYSAPFYGKFLGVDVANFFRNSIWPNRMLVEARFKGSSAVANLLEHAPADFTTSRSVLNIQIVDYMLTNRPDLADEVVAFLIAEQGEDAMDFLDAFLNATTVDDATTAHNATHKVELVGRLAAHPWSGLLNHLALQDAVADEATRTALLDVAILGVQDAMDYDLDEDARQLIIHRHAELDAFTARQDGNRTDVLVSLVRRVGLIVPSLGALGKELCNRVVEDGSYELTGDNLRTALDLDDHEPLTLDRIHQVDAVWKRCRDDADAYFDTVADDEPTAYAVLTAATLSRVIAEQHATWTDKQMARLLGASSPDAALEDITVVPQSSWPSIAEARRMAPSTANLSAYSEALGIEGHLAKALTDAEGIPVELVDLDDATPEVAHNLMVKILSASAVLTSSNRVRLAKQLQPSLSFEEVLATELNPMPDDLLAEALEAELVPDAFETFEHFLTAGWTSVSKAFKASKAVHDFLTPSLVAGHVSDLLGDPNVPNTIKEKVVTDLESYAAADSDHNVLQLAATLALRNKIQLTLDQVELIAPHASQPEHILWQLASMGESIDGSAAIRILGQLGDDYGGFLGSPGDEFDLPISTSTKDVLGYLRSKGLIELPRGGPRDRKKVKLL